MSHFTDSLWFSEWLWSIKPWTEARQHWDTLQSTCHKVPAIMWDVHAVDGPWLGALQLSDGGTIVGVPVDDLHGEVKTQGDNEAMDESNSH